MYAIRSYYDNFVYSKAKLDQDMHWYEKNVMGSGPFLFDGREAGAVIRGKRNPNYFHKGKPYLDGFEATYRFRPGRLPIRAAMEGEHLRRITSYNVCYTKLLRGFGRNPNR